MKTVSRTPDGISLTYLYQPAGKLQTTNNAQPHFGRTSTRDAIVMLKLRHHVASQRIQDFLEAFFHVIQYKMRYLVVSKKNNPLFVWGCDRKSVPRDHRLSSLGKPRNGNRRSSGRIFLSHPSNSWSVLSINTISMCEEMFYQLWICKCSGPISKMNKD